MLNHQVLKGPESKNLSKTDQKQQFLILSALTHLQLDGREQNPLNLGFGVIYQSPGTRQCTVTDLDSSCSRSLLKITPKTPGYPWVSGVGMFPRT